IQRAQASLRGPVEFCSHVPPGKMMLPGAIVFTRTPLAPTSFASSFDRWFIAALDVPYVSEVPSAPSPAIELMNTNEPSLRGVIGRSAARASRNDESRF